MAPIHDAANEADVEALTALLASGESPNVRNDLERTPLHKLFTWSTRNQSRGEDHVACFELLLRYGADVNAMDQDGSTALNYLTAGGTTGQWVERLINAGADVRVASRTTGATTLHRAAFNGNCDVVRLLIRAGAALDAVNVDGHTPLEHAITAPFLFNNHRTYPILLRAGARLPDLDSIYHIKLISDTHPGLPYLRKVRAAGSFANYERLHLDKLVLMLTPRRGPSSPLRRVPPELIRRIVAFAFHAGSY